MMTDKEFVEKAFTALYSQTLYVNGAFGAPATAYNKTRYSNSRNSGRIAKIKAAPLGTFFFDCVCLIKGILWGWDANLHDRNGGAKYASNGVPDVGEDSMIRMCTYSSTDFAGIVPGAVVWIPGHIGIYVGNGLVIEATAAWTGNVLMSCCANVGRKEGYPQRTWTKWGMLPWVRYTDKEDDMTKAETEKLIREMFPALYAEAKKEEEKAIAEMPASSDYAQKALDWMREQGFMTGDKTGNMMPRKALTREENAIIEYNEAKANGRA